ncbi:MAG: glycosyltransferase family 1 protein [Candidatus Electrothrix sp. EH2]|nr:glycosyltransferase family 1 protein [Candidatus Electrothrix sp. EH2]
MAHLHNIYHQLTPSIIRVLKKHNVKVVLTLHDYKLICPFYLALQHNGRKCLECAGNKFWKPVILNCQNSRLKEILFAIESIFHKWKGSYELVDLFLTPSQFLADLLSSRIASKKIKVLYNGVDINSYLPSYSDQNYALYFGRISKEKGIETLLKTHSKYANTFPLKVVGTGEMENYFAKKYTDAEFLGYKKCEDLKKIISNAAFVIVPSEWYENCSMTVLEAMASGKAVIGSSIGGIPEQIDDGISGFLFKPGDILDLASKLNILINSVDKRISMGDAARLKIIKKYSLQNHNSNLLKIYNDIIS